MKRPDPTHYTPKAAPGLAKHVRIAACGVRTNMGLLPDGENEARYGSSNISYVTCQECLATKGGKR